MSNPAILQIPEETLRGYSAQDLGFYYSLLFHHRSEASVQPQIDLVTRLLREKPLAQRQEIFRNMCVDSRSCTMREEHGKARELSTLAQDYQAKVLA